MSDVTLREPSLKLDDQAAGSFRRAYSVILVSQIRLMNQQPPGSVCRSTFFAATTTVPVLL